MSSLLRLERQQKTFLKLRVEFAYFSFFLIYNTFIHFLSLLENHTRFQTGVGKVYTRFQTETAQKPYPLGRQLPYWLIQGISTGVLNYLRTFVLECKHVTFCSTAWTSWSSLSTSTIRQFILHNISIVKNRWIHSTLISSRLLLLP